MSQLAEPKPVAFAQDEIDALRAEIDAIDEQLLGLLNRRLSRAQQIGAKFCIDAPVLQSAREGQLLDALCARNAGPLDAAHLRLIWREILTASRYLQSEPVVAYLGPFGTYTEDAMRTHFGVAHPSIPCESVDAVFDSVTQGRAAFGVVPIENSTEGVITRTLDLMLARGLRVSAEVVLPVQHSLMSKHGALSGIDCVLGHEQALGQCRRWLDDHLPGVPRRTVPSNARAAQLATVEPASAAIGSRRAAGHYGLQIAAAAIQDERQNSTRFYVIGPDQPQVRGATRTLLCIELDNRPGALQRMLAPLADREIAVTRLDSRPLKSELWAYRFFVELQRDQHDAAVAAALAEIRLAAQDVVVLGSFAAATDTPAADADRDTLVNPLEHANAIPN